MSDLIERDAVLKLIQENWYGSNAFYMNKIKELPAVDAAPEQEKGDEDNDISGTAAESGDTAEQE